MSDNKDFFKKQTDSSRVKAAIISEYFPQYCHIISRRHTPQRFGYFDMFAGPGIYEDESWSTPLLVAKNCYEDTFLRDKVWMVFKVTRCQARCYVMILSPNYHRIVHKANPHFNRKTLSFEFSNGLIEKVKLNRHL